MYQHSCCPQYSDSWFTYVTCLYLRIPVSNAISTCRLPGSRLLVRNYLSYPEFKPVFFSGVRVAFYGRHNGLTVTEYMLQTTRILALRYRSYNPVLLSSFMTYHRICNTSYARVAISATGTANLSGVPEINPFFSDNCMFVCPFIFCHWIVCSS